MAAAEPAPADEDILRVPTADETDRAIGRANRALAEIYAREAEADEAERYRGDQLNQYHADDQAAEHQDADYDQTDAW